MTTLLRWLARVTLSSRVVVVLEETAALRKHALRRAQQSTPLRIENAPAKESALGAVTEKQQSTANEST